jgi:hypothetical protein
MQRTNPSGPTQTMAWTKAQSVPRPPPIGPPSAKALLLCGCSPQENYSNANPRAKRAQAIRVRANKGLNQSMLMDHWPELRPASLPIYPGRWLRHPPPFQKAYPSSAGNGTPRIESAMTPQRGPPSPSRIPHRVPHPRQVRATRSRALSDTSRTYPRWAQKKPIPLEDGDTPTASPRIARAPTPDHSTASAATCV